LEHAAHGRAVVGESGIAEPSTSSLANLDQVATVDLVRINVGEAKTNLSQLLARVQAGEDVEIARNGVPVERPGERFLKGWGAMAGQIWIADDFELSEEELDQMDAEMDEDDEVL
jgi:antitoxin (DNA-binding transcriptional repressor) of toxin-antitoxin stability system